MKEIFEALEKIYGTLEEILLNEAVENVVTFKHEANGSYFLTNYLIKKKKKKKFTTTKNMKL